jgi:DNA-binding NtrC family response regulator
MGDTRDIVIYEEDHQTRTLIKEWLGDAGYRVRIGNRCDPGGDGTCDLVIVSIYMPKQGGVDYVRGIQEAHPGTPLLATSGQFRPGLAAAGSTAHRLRVQQVLAKPLMRKELLDVVRGIIGP